MAMALGLAALAVLPAHAVAALDPATGTQPDLDARGGEQAPVAAPAAAARTALDKSLGDQGTLAADPVTGGLRQVARTDGFLTGPSGQDPEAVALGYVRDHAAAFGLDAADLAQLVPATRTVSGDGVTHLTWTQSVGGVPAYDSALSANVTGRGELINVGGAPVHDLAPPSTDPPLGPGAARAAAQRDLGVAADGAPGDVGAGPVRTTTFPGGDQASLVTLADPGGDHLAWKLIVAGQAPATYEVLVDAATGAVLSRRSLTDFVSPARVYERHPGAPMGGTLQTVDLDQHGWLPTPSAGLIGPNVHAYADRRSPDGLGGDHETTPSSGGDFLYAPVFVTTPAAGQTCPTLFTTPCTWDGSSTSSGDANADRVAVQVFYYANKFHDWLRDQVGFTSSSYNFEGTDPVLAEVDDFSDTNNSSFTSKPDGTSGKLQSYLFRAPYPAVDGGDDAGIIYHELAHGLSNRLVGNDGLANGLVARQSRAMGEGWSDYYAMDYLVEQGLVTDGSAPGDVVFGEYPTDNAQPRLRADALDCPPGAVSARCPGTTSAGPGGLTFADLGRVLFAGDAQHPYFEVHADGEIWSQTLWDLRRTLGGATARTLITRAMRLSPKQPSFLDMRNAILEADQVGGGTHQALIWQIFAQRGMGYGAATTSASATRGEPSFVTPPIADAGAPDVQSPPPLGDGDAALEPGEAARVRIPLENAGDAPLTNVRATLTSSTPGVVVGHASVSYGTIPVGYRSNSGLPFAVTVTPSVGCATVLALTMSVTSDQGAMTVPVSLPLGSGSGTVASTDVPRPIPDTGRGAGVDSTVTLPPGRVGDLRVALGVTHSWVGDLHAWLTSPSGTMVDLFEDIGPTLRPSSRANLDIVLDDDAASPIQDVTGASTDHSPIAGTYQPDQSLGAFDGESRGGTWTLRIVDDTSGNSGTLDRWSLQTDEPACSTSAPALPSAATGEATPLDATSVTLTGTVTPGGTSTDAAFEIGPDTRYGATTVKTAAAGAVAIPVGGLTTGQTYHYRAVALREGTVVATGEDRAFVAQAPPQTQGQGEIAPPGRAGTSPGPGQVQVFSIPKPTLRGVPKSVTVDSKGRVTLAFVATPASTAGSVTLMSARAVALTTGAGKRVLTAGTKAFTVPRSTKVKLRITVAAKVRSYLRRHASLRTKATIRINGTPFSATITIKAPKKTVVEHR
ncbi:MAG: extracellular elastinolytic metalloproteinase [Baekduia sp.]|nr:extracellular elastinolytic metalloproteinase [Baekduia sp.]